MSRPRSTVSALLLAGSRPKADERGLGRGDLPKALLEVDGEPMIARVARNLLASERVGDIRIVAQDAAALIARAGIDTARVLPGTGGASASLAVNDALGKDWPYLVVTADHALLTPAIIEEFAGRALQSGADLCVGVVSRDVLQARFPHSRRTWLKFRGGAYTGANLFFLANDRVRGALEIWKTVEQQRKKGRAIVGAFGPLLLAGAGLRLLTLDQAIAAAGRKVGCTAAAISLSEAEAAIDVDTQEDLILVERILRMRREP